jgi:hypothetical protein
MDSHTILHYAHILIIGPLLLAIGFIKPESISPLLYKVIFGSGLFILFYHAYKAYMKIMDKGFGSAWVNYIHILLVAPVLIAIGYGNGDAPRYFREICMMLGFAAIGYHGIYLLK